MVQRVEGCETHRHSGVHSAADAVAAIVDAGRIRPWDTGGRRGRFHELARPENVNAERQRGHESAQLSEMRGFGRRQRSAERDPGCVTPAPQVVVRFSTHRHRHGEMQRLAGIPCQPFAQRRRRVQRQVDVHIRHPAALRLEHAVR